MWKCLKKNSGLWFKAVIDNEFTQAWYTSISQNKFQKQGMSCYLKVIN